MGKRISRFQYIKNKIKLPLQNFFGGKLFGKLRTVYWIRKLKRGEFYEYENEIRLLPYFVKNGDICIDVGANIGQYTYPLSKLVGPKGKVFSFEPVAHAFRILKNVVKKLKLNNVNIQQVALGDRKGKGRFILTFGGGYFWDGKEINCKTQKVKFETLDALSEKLPVLSRVSFIKCDVEGTELMVVKGGKNLISKARPIILCEIEKRWTKRYGYFPEEIFNFLSRLGYKPFIFFSGELKEVQGVQDSANNYIFIPEKFIPDFKENYYKGS